MGRIRRSAPLFGVVAASSFSQLGNAVASVALPWFVLTLTDSAAWTGVAAAAGMVPLVLGAFFSGPLIDRLGARRVAVTADLVGAASVAAVPVLFLTGELTLVWLLALIVIAALLDGPGMTAQDARLPELARLAGLPVERVTSIDELLENAAAILGPAIAGLAIVALGVERTLFITAACSLSAGVINAVSLPRHRRAARKMGSDAVLAGARFLLGDALLRTILILAMVVLAVFGALNAVVVPALLRAGDGSALDLGLFLAAAGTGAAIAAIGFAVRGHKVNGRIVLLLGLAGATASVGTLAIAQPPLTWIAAGALGLSTGALGPLVDALFLRRAPSAIRASVLGATTAAALVATPIAVLLAGLGADLVGPRPVLGGLALILAALAAFAASNPVLHALSHRLSLPLLGRRTDEQNIHCAQLKAAAGPQSPCWINPS